jgi:hypothetical protein
MFLGFIKTRQDTFPCRQAQVFRRARRRDALRRTSRCGIMREPMQNGRTERTVLVLGAGASKPYGFPLGHELKSIILESLRPVLVEGSTEWRGFKIGLISEFQESFRYSALPTIDQFLEKKPKFRDLGAYLIARVLLPLENRNKLFPHSDWHGYLFECMNFDGDDLDPSFLSIVTLNYERSLEEFLTWNIQWNCHQDRIEHAHEKRKRIRIVHAHGSLGPYPEVPYGGGGDAQVTEQALVDAAKNIKIVSDNLEDSPDFKIAQGLIAEADRVIFLGFGYHERVLKGLFAKAKLENMLIGGCGYGVRESDHKAACSAIGKHITVMQSGVDANGFIRHVPLVRETPPGAFALGLPW